MFARAVRSNGNSDAFDVSKPEPLFDAGPSDDSGLDRGWDVTADGERFLIRVRDSVSKGPEAALELILIQNWGDELKRLVPVTPK